MKLAIVVVYIVDERQGGLLDIHLDRIERHTSVPWTIYANVSRLLPAFRGVLERRPGVRIFDPPATHLRSSAEHAHYLEPMIRSAIDDGASHVVTLHVDSFPIADGWIEHLAERTASAYAFASVPRINTACLFFPREFHLSHSPKLLLTSEEQSGPDWASYRRDIDPVLHCGMGYGFAAHRAGLSWYSLPYTAGAHGTPGSSIFGDMLFHLDGALRLSTMPADAGPLVRMAGLRPARAFEDLGKRAIDTMRSMTPRRHRRLIRRFVPKNKVDRLVLIPRRRLMAEGMWSEVGSLLADPDGYVEKLRAASHERQ